MCLGRNRDAASRTACHSIIPNQFVSSTLILASGPLSEPVIHFIVEELMKDGQGLSAAWGTHSDLPHRCRQGCNFSSLSAKSRRETYFRKNSSHLNGPNFFWESISCCSYVTVSSGTSAVTSCASVSERIHSSSWNWFEVGSFVFLQKHQLCVEQEAALFRQVSCRPLDS